MHGPSDQVTKVTEGGRGWERYCTWAQRRAALPRRGRAQRSFGANKGISARACLFSTFCVGGLDIAHGWRWEEKEKVTFSVGRGYLVGWVPQASTQLQISMDMGPSTPAERRF